MHRHPGRTALINREGDVRYTYEAWHERCVDVASALGGHGIGEGDSVATAMRNRVETSTLYCATQLLGAIFGPYKFRLSAEELTYLLDNINPDILFFSDDVKDVIAPTIDQTDIDFGTAADALDEHCLRSEELADYKRPRKYYFIDEFLKTYVGKILRNELQKQDLDIDVYGEVNI